MYETIIPSMNKMLSEGVRKFCAHPKWVRTCKTMLWTFGSHVSVLIEDASYSSKTGYGCLIFKFLGSRSVCLVPNSPFVDYTADTFHG